jgi:subtilisin-like proprotein convertase family protein
MDTRSSAIGMVAPLFLLTVFSSAAFSDPVYTYGGDFNLPLLDPIGPGSAMTEAVIEVPDHIVISDLDVGISLTHTNVFDLQLFLQGPTGTRICLNMFDFKKEFSVYPNYTNTIFDDEAMLSIKEGVAPFTGRFRPLEPYKLSDFDGEDAYGLWLLQIYDMWPTDTGTFNHLELTITAPEPATAILLTLGVCLIRLCRPRSNPKNVYPSSFTLSEVEGTAISIPSPCTFCLDIPFVSGYSISYKPNSECSKRERNIEKN